MKKLVRVSALLLSVAILSGFGFWGKIVEASSTEKTSTVAVEQTQENSTGSKAIASAVAIGLAGLGGTIGMGLAISKTADAISRQPEAESKIRSALMIGLVFIETVVIYALIVAILVIFVL